MATDPPSIEELVAGELKTIKGEYEERIMGAAIKTYYGLKATQIHEEVYYITLHSIAKGVHVERPALCAIGDKTIDFQKIYSLQEVLKAGFAFFEGALGIFNEKLHDSMKKQLAIDPDSIILPPIEQQHLINSKVDYLKLLREAGYISTDTQILFPFDQTEEANPINFQDGPIAEAHFAELQGYLLELEEEADQRKETFRQLHHDLDEAEARVARLSQALAEEEADEAGRGGGRGVARR